MKGSLVVPAGRRRLLAVLFSVATVFAVLGLAPSATADQSDTDAVTGSVIIQYWDGGQVVPIPVTAYRQTGDPDDPWTKAATTGTGSNGRYRFDLPPGTYRFTVNEAGPGVPTAHAYKAINLSEGDPLVDDNRNFVVGDGGLELGMTILEPLRSNLLTGRVVDQCGDGVASTVEAYPSDDGDNGPADFLSVLNDRDFYLPALDVPAKLHVIGPDGSSTWIGGDSFATATPVVAHDSDPYTTVKAVVRRDLLPATGKGPTIQGTVRHPQYSYGLSGIPVQVYQSASGGQGPWTLAGSTVTSTDGQYTFSAATGNQLPVGEYRVALNQGYDGHPANPIYTTTFVGGATMETGSTVCAEGDRVSGASDALAFSGGLLTGTLADSRGAEVEQATIDVYSAQTPTDGSDPKPVATIHSYERTFSVQTIEGGVKLHVTPQGPYLPQWVGGTSFDTATTFDVAPGTTSGGHAIVLADGPLKNTVRPQVTGRARTGAHLKVSGDGWTSPVTKTYRWYRGTGTHAVMISGATKSTYVVKTADVGKVLSARVTGHPKSATAGPGAVTASSSATHKIKRTTQLSIKAKVSGHKVKVTLKITVAGIAHPHGKVKIAYARLKGNDISLETTGKITRKTITFSHGKATFTFTGRKKTWYSIGADVVETSSAAGADDSTAARTK